MNPSTAHLTTNMTADTMASFYDEVRASSNRMCTVLTGSIVLHRSRPSRRVLKSSMRISREYRTCMRDHSTTRMMLQQRAIPSNWKNLLARQVHSAQLSSEGSKHWNVRVAMHGKHRSRSSRSVLCYLIMTIVGTDRL